MRTSMIFGLFLLLPTACSKDSCYNRHLAESHSRICPTVIDPVCACDGETYNNSCEANAAGLLVDYEGACR